MNPDPQMNQWWADNDPRNIIGGVYQRVGMIVEWGVHPTKGYERALVAWRKAPGPGPQTRSRTWVSCKRLKTSDYVWLGEGVQGAPPPNAGPAYAASRRLRFQTRGYFWPQRFGEHGEEIPERFFLATMTSPDGCLHWSGASSKHAAVEVLDRILREGVPGKIRVHEYHRKGEG